MKAVLSLLFCVAILGLSGGCGSTPTATVTAAAGTQVLTVDSAMQAWADWVRAGYATQAQVDVVKSAYNKYYAAAQVEKDALKAYVASASSTNAPTAQFMWQDAAAALAAAQGDLIALIQQFQRKTNQP